MQLFIKIRNVSYYNDFLSCDNEDWSKSQTNYNLKYIQIENYFSQYYCFYLMNVKDFSIMYKKTSYRPQTFKWQCNF